MHSLLAATVGLTASCQSKVPYQLGRPAAATTSTAIATASATATATGSRESAPARQAPTASRGPLSPVGASRSRSRDGQGSAAGDLPVRYVVRFGEPVDPRSFTLAALVQRGTATGIVWQVTDQGDHATFDLTATAADRDGSVQPDLVAGAAKSPAGAPTAAPTGPAPVVTLAVTPTWPGCRRPSPTPRRFAVQVTGVSAFDHAVGPALDCSDERIYGTPPMAAPAANGIAEYM